MPAQAPEQAAAPAHPFQRPIPVSGDYGRDGVVALHGVADPARLLLLRERAVAMFDLFDSLTESQLAALDSGDYRFHGALPYRRIDAGFDILNALHPGLVPLVTALLGSEKAALRNCIVRRMQPQRTETRASFHQDLQFLWPHDLPMATVWIPLDPLDGSRPGLQVLPRRLSALAGPSRTQRQKDDPAFTDYAEGGPGEAFDLPIALDEEAVAALAPGVELWEPHLACGDVLVFDGLTVHRSALRPDMAHARISVELRLSVPPPGLDPAAGEAKA
ncbi:phytanoyl-CoA dioxygenase family protein [Marinibaculum pumilum]|uniref:Phytanoyl-CoA dioxygenase family protein n=1 Tax=Marinibaculum pumilum TaxID=1766165 RepID=A0ABV7L3K2_9PROT